MFAQRAEARVDADAWDAQGSRFFATRVRVEEPGEIAAAARLLVVPEGASHGVRRVLGRQRAAEDLALAEKADARAGDTGLALLARRCQTVWLVERVGDDDALALRLAAVLASAMLGPILDVHHDELFGVKTARAKLERGAAKA